jgi:hypothetical protein
MLSSWSTWPPARRALLRPVSARICLDLLPEDQQPKSRAAPFSKAWGEDQIDAEFLKELVNRWRRQR